MKVEVWSDIMCPFCYIGKRHFERALEKFENRNQVEIEWKSYQLNPSVGKEGIAHKDYLIKEKNISSAQVDQMLENVTAMASRAGLIYDLDKAIVANSFDAHRLSHLAKKYNKQDEVEESLFRAHFTEGKNIADSAVLLEIAAQAKLPESEAQEMLNGKQFAKEVLDDIEEASRLGIRGVPFFVFDRKYAVSGAQPVEVFLETLTTAFNDIK
jgi:protein disulfide-isomerase